MGLALAGPIMFTGWLGKESGPSQHRCPDWALLLTSSPYLCWSCPSCLTPQDPHFPRVQKLKQWGNRGTQEFSTWPCTLILFGFSTGGVVGGQCEPRGSVIQGPVPVG